MSDTFTFQASDRILSELHSGRTPFTLGLRPLDFQSKITVTLFYAWVYARRKNDPELHIQPGLINRKEIFKDKFEYGLVMDKHPMKDVTPFLPEFENHLVKLLTELFDPRQPFDQTTDEKKCGYCPYKEICGR